MKILHPGYPNCTQGRFWSACANAQADLNLRWMHMRKGAFSDVTVHMNKLFRKDRYQEAKPSKGNERRIDEDKSNDKSKLHNCNVRHTYKRKFAIECQPWNGQHKKTHNKTKKKKKKLLGRRIKPALLSQSLTLNFGAAHNNKKNSSVRVRSSTLSVRYYNKNAYAV